MIADLHAGDVRPDRLDDAGALVPEDDRRRVRHDALDVVKIAVADAARDVADPDLVGARLLQVEHLDLDALTGLVVNRRLDLHRCTSSRAGASASTDASMPSARAARRTRHQWLHRNRSQRSEVDDSPFDEELTKQIRGLKP